MALIETLQDNFDDNSRDTTKWTYTGTNFSEENGQLWITTLTSATYHGYTSIDAYDLTSSSAKIELVYFDTEFLAAIPSIELFPLDLIKDSNNKYRFIITSNGRINAYKLVGGINTYLADVVYNPASHRWLRIRESGGTTYWDYSADGETWTNLTSEANAFAITTIYLGIYAGTYSTETTTTTVIFDNLNTTHVDHSADNPRRPVQNTSVSWKRDFDATNSPFTIGVSAAGGSNFLGGGGELLSAWDYYSYSDESDYVIDLSYERTLNMPLGGISIARANVSLDNTSGRFLPRSMAGVSELFTAMLPQRPIIINTGFNYDGSDNLQRVFVGLLDKNPEVSARDRRVDISAMDFLNYINNRRVDDTAIYTGQRVDQILEDIFVNKFGLFTSQFELDVGLGTIPFAMIEAGTKYYDFVNRVVQGEMGHLLQDESGKIMFWNRQKWVDPPYNLISEIIYTPDVINVEAPDDDHIVNIVEVRATPREKTSGATVFTLNAPVTLYSGENEVWIDFDNPTIAVTSNMHTANSNSDDSGTNDTANVLLSKTSVFTRTAKYTFTNNTSRVSYLTALTVTGRWATVVDEIYRTGDNDSSLTAFDERVLTIQNDFIQTETWANSYIQLILDQLAEPEDILKMTIRAKPQLSLGDLISWQGHYWRIFSMKTQMSAQAGFIQQLQLVQRTSSSYFAIGTSSIGGTDMIAP